MPVIPKVVKGPSASYPHTFDFSGWDLLTTSNTLSSATATVSPSGLTLGSPTVSADDKQVSVNISSGTLGDTYRVTVLATTSDGDVLDAYLDVVVAVGAGDGAAVYPSQLLPYLDTRRAMELLYDDGELDEDEDAPDGDVIDGNERAFALCQAAWREVVMAATRGELYTLQQLTDLAADPVRGQDLVSLVADLFWRRLVRRRRYVKGEPQADDAAGEAADQLLEALRRGERIFNLEGVADSVNGGTYENELGERTALSVGRLGSTDLDHPEDRFWGCTNTDRSDPRYRGGSWWTRGSC
jgi:hypothetical protein